MRVRRIAVLSAALACCAATLAAASERAAAALTQGWVEPDDARLAGLTITLAPGWKTYWRAPGDAGIAPLFDWSASRNLAEIAVIWPTPQLFESFGLTTIGYDEAVTLPLRLTPADPALPIELRLSLDYGVCADLCVPERAELTLRVPADRATQPRGPIAEAMAQAPLDAAEAGLERAECAVRGAGPERRFEARLAFEGAPPPVAMLVVEGPPGAWFGPAEMRLEGSVLQAQAEAQIWDEAAWISREALRLTLLGGERAIDLRGCVGAGG